MNICVENIVFKTELPDKCAGLLEIYGVSIIRNRIEANITLPPPPSHPLVTPAPYELKEQVKKVCLLDGLKIRIAMLLQN